MEYFQTAEPTKLADETKRYNREAVEATRAALEAFNADDSDYKKGKKSTDPLAQKLGGWDSRHLLPATSSYVASIYSDIFQKLAPEVRLAFTKAMLLAATATADRDGFRATLTCPPLLGRC